MIRRIREHNQLNGQTFSTVEFLIVALAAGFIGLGFLLHGRWVAAVLAIGIASNALVVTLFGIAALRRGERGESLRRLRDPAYRDRVKREHPTLARDTLVITVTVLLPFVMLALVMIETARGAS